eukprot:6309312-Amphidinium_carterae.1
MDKFFEITAQTSADGVDLNFVRVRIWCDIGEVLRFDLYGCVLSVCVAVFSTTENTPAEWGRRLCILECLLGNCHVGGMVAAVASSDVHCIALLL